MTLGQIIKQYRTEHHLSQRQFAILCGVSNGYISMLEEGKNPKTNEPIIPSLMTLKKLASAMAMTLDELMIAADEMPITLSLDIEPNLPEIDLQLFARGEKYEALTEAESEILKLFRMIPEEKQRDFLEMGRLFANSLKRD
jgi:transcriptional regulator with XRE-family HTH domain